MDSDTQTVRYVPVSAIGLGLSRAWFVRDTAVDSADPLYVAECPDEDTASRVAAALNASD